MTTAFGEQAALLRENAWRYFEGLTDDELHWEPVPGMWGLRLKTELRTPLEEGAADGDYWLDSIRPAPEPAPLTTIAWRVGHLTLGTWNWNAFIEDVPVPPEPALRHDAAGAIEPWREVLDRFVEVVQAVPDEKLDQASRAWDGKATFANVIAHVTLEIAFHSAEVGTMRHLYREMHADR